MVRLIRVHHSLLSSYLTHLYFLVLLSLRLRSIRIERQLFELLSLLNSLHVDDDKVYKYIEFNFFKLLDTVLINPLR